MSGWTPLRIGMQIVATVFLMGGIGVTVYGVVDPAWQTVNITEDAKFHEHGLWRDCITSTLPKKVMEKRGIVPFCSFKFNQPTEEEFEKSHGEEGHSHGGFGDDKNTSYQHMNLKFHRVVLGLLASACALGFLSLLISFCAFCFKPASVIWAVLNLICTGLVAGGLVVFFRYSHDKDYRFIYKSERKYEQLLGHAFWLSVGGCLAFLSAGIISMVGAVIHFIADRRVQQNHKKMIWPKAVHSSAV